MVKNLLNLKYKILYKNVKNSLYSLTQKDFGFDIAKNI